MTSHTNKRLNIVIIAGEASGDKHAAHLVQEIKAKHRNIQFSGIGGSKMQNAGVTLIEDLKHLNVMGYTEVIRHFKVIREIFKRTEKYLQETKPDLLLLVDYPGFNLRLAKKAKAMGVKVLYYISPQLWAWKAGRMKTIKTSVDMMAVILPFEKKIYDDANVLAHFVGHPLTQTVRTTLPENTLDNTIRAKWGLPLGQKIIGILPGSRRGEIKRMFPIMLKAAELLQKHYGNLTFILPIAPTLSPQDFEPYCKKSSLRLHYISADHYDIIKTCHCLMITSGTATLEAALLIKPMVIVYKTSFINYAIAIKVIRTKYIGLCNILAQKMIVPEIIQNDLTPKNLFQAIQRFIDDPEYYQATEKRLQAVKDSLTASPTDLSLAELVVDCLEKH